VLDAVDAVLVRELQRDGRATFQALADRVGLSRTAVRTRVQHLLDSGIVRVVGIVHASVIGTGAIGHLFVDVDGPARHVVDAVARKSAAWFAALATGAHAVVAEVRVRDDTKLAQEVDAVRSLPGVRGVEVFRVISVVKDAHSVVTGELRRGGRTRLVGRGHRRRPDRPPLRNQLRGHWIRSL
jgi:DNA-binding Lrp family transcriptional regulator